MDALLQVNPLFRLLNCIFIFLAAAIADISHGQPLSDGCYALGIQARCTPVHTHTHDVLQQKVLLRVIDLVVRGAVVDADATARFVHDLKLQCGNAFPASVCTSTLVLIQLLNSHRRKSMYWMLYGTYNVLYSWCWAPKDGACA